MTKRRYSGEVEFRRSFEDEAAAACVEMAESRVDGAYYERSARATKRVHQIGLAILWLKMQAEGQANG